MQGKNKDILTTQKKKKKKTNRNEMKQKQLCFVLLLMSKQIAQLIRALRSQPTVAFQSLCLDLIYKE